jgi:hypothetical protein
LPDPWKQAADVMASPNLFVGKTCEQHQKHQPEQSDDDSENPPFESHHAPLPFWK